MFYNVMTSIWLLCIQQVITKSLWSCTKAVLNIIFLIKKGMRPSIGRRQDQILSKAQKKERENTTKVQYLRKKLKEHQFLRLIQKGPKLFIHETPGLHLSQDQKAKQHKIMPNSHNLGGVLLGKKNETCTLLLSISHRAAGFVVTLEKYEMKFQFH